MGCSPTKEAGGRAEGGAGAPPAQGGPPTRQAQSPDQREAADARVAMLEAELEKMTRIAAKNLAEAEALRAELDLRGGARTAGGDDEEMRTLEQPAQPSQLEEQAVRPSLLPVAHWRS